MSSGSDSDPFDEGGLTARGRRAKGKSGARASEKGKQKAKEVRTATPIPRGLLNTNAALALHSKGMPGRPHMLVPGTQYRKMMPEASLVPLRSCSRADGDGGVPLVSQYQDTITDGTSVKTKTKTKDFSRQLRRYAVR